MAAPSHHDGSTEFFIPPTYGNRFKEKRSHPTANPAPCYETNNFGQNNSHTVKTATTKTRFKQVNANHPGYEEYVSGLGPVHNKIDAGHLDLTLYDRKPKPKSKPNPEAVTVIVNSANNELDQSGGAGNAVESQSADSQPPAEKKKKRRFRNPRRNSKIDKLISFLEDKRIKDDSELYQLEDLQMPRLRRVLNIIFVTLGVLFLLGVVVVILYTKFAPNPTPDEHIG